ncbi:MAG: hypothetical protein BroJett030_29770 [Alphaproteobacteria bacterium]|nr:MAG: hypothetical protein BroJett030_29770 [Alphaproteobacteria bacterium]
MAGRLEVTWAAAGHPEPNPHELAAGAGRVKSRATREHALAGYNAIQLIRLLHAIDNLSYIAHSALPKREPGDKPGDVPIHECRIRTTNASCNDATGSGRA